MSFSAKYLVSRNNMATINMQTMRYINLLDRVSHVKTTRCFAYNNNIMFAIPEGLMRKAIGINGQNVRDMQYALGKRVKFVSEPRGIEDAQRFIQSIVEPVTFKSLLITEDEIILTAGSSSKASLIGRDKARLLELAEIVKDFFGRQFRIV